MVRARYTGSGVSAPPIYVVAGLPGVGKSTTSRVLTERFERSAHVEADALQAMAVRGAVLPDPDGIGPEARRHLDLRLRQACRVAAAFADDGFVAVIDDLVIGPSVDVVRTELTGRELRFVMLCPTFEHVRSRWLEMGSPFADRWDWIDRVIRHDTERLGLWLDTTTLSPAETVDRILAHPWQNYPEAGLDG